MLTRKVQHGVSRNHSVPCVKQMTCQETAPTPEFKDQSIPLTNRGEEVNDARSASIRVPLESEVMYPS